MPHSPTANHGKQPSQKLKPYIVLQQQADGGVHRPHDGRMHFVTMAKKYHVDEYAIKYMIGHEINDITEKVYTQREAGWLCEEIAKIP